MGLHSFTHVLTPDDLLLTLYSEGEGERGVVFVHGMAENWYTNPIFKFRSYLTRLGLNFASFDNRGADIIKMFREGSGGWRILGTALERFEDCVLDIKAVLDALDWKEYVLMGHSTGCHKAVYYYVTQEDLRVKALVLLSPSDDRNVWLDMMGADRYFSLLKAKLEGNKDELFPEIYKETGWYLSYDRFLSIMDPSRPEGNIFDYTKVPMPYISKIKVPTLFLFPEEDEFSVRVFREKKKALERSYKGPYMEVDEIEGADHMFSGKEGLMALRVAQFLSRVFS